MFSIDNSVCIYIILLDSSGKGMISSFVLVWHFNKLQYIFLLLPLFMFSLFSFAFLFHVWNEMYFINFIWDEV